MDGLISRNITVYRDHPEWSRHTRWFNMPLALLEGLFVIRYVVQGVWVDDADVERHVKEIEQKYPGCILVY